MRHIPISLNLPNIDIRNKARSEVTLLNWRRFGETSSPYSCQAKTKKNVQLNLLNIDITFSNNEPLSYCLLCDDNSIDIKTIDGSR